MIKYSLVLILGLTCFSLIAQDDLLSLLEDEQEPTQTFTQSSFKGTRIINGHSVETRREGNLDFIISHRFGTLNSGSYELWGLDQSNIRIALEYSLSDNFTFGAGRNSFEKTYDGFVKYKLLKQQTGIKNIPVSVVWFSSITAKTLHRFDGVKTNLNDKLAYTNQVLIARKINSSLSLQISPTYIHYNLIELDETSNDVLAVGIGGRYKITNRLTVNAEYFPQLSDKGNQYQDAIAFGVDIETGGHVFQLQFSNATAMIEKGFVGETKNDFFGGDIHFGFNISRAFQLKK
ncbi:MAG: DUF5777 family beta-barrel protein [Cyclobacteriaceae bacterium]